MRILDFVILAMWVLFWLYWIATAVGVKGGRTPPTQYIGVRLGVAAVLLILFLLRVDVIRESSLGVIANPAVQGVGFGLFVLGLALAVWARVYLAGNWGMPMSEKVGGALVTTGPYRYIRHPIYAGLILAMLGTAVAVSLEGLVAVAVLGSYFVFSASVEERTMSRLFPVTYPAYRKSTHMLIPFIL